MDAVTTTNQASKYAIVEHGGRQFRVEEGEVLAVDHVEGEVGAEVEFGRPLLVQEAREVRIGKPHVNGAKVVATILAHERDRKILVFKFKKVKNYRRKRGHRQEITRLRIDRITL
jgi:large subunit ribosomal protein L21